MQIINRHIYIQCVVKYKQYIYNQNTKIYQVKTFV